MRWCHAFLILFLPVASMAQTVASPVSGKGVGLGVAGGLAYNATTLQGFNTFKDKASHAWGFFVDIPLLTTFYISPSAMLYETNLGKGKQPVTDIDLNFKFIAPVWKMKLGVGVLGGVSNAEGAYRGHFGGLGYVSYNVFANIDVFAMMQYKYLVRVHQDTHNLHTFLGGMFYF
jgi:hypothetical protein